MKSRETLIRLKKFQVDEKRRKVAQIEAMIAEFDRSAGHPEREIKFDEDSARFRAPADRLTPLIRAPAHLTSASPVKDQIRMRSHEIITAVPLAFDDSGELDI